MAEYSMEELFADIRGPLAKLTDAIIEHRSSDVLEAGRELYRLWWKALARQGVDLLSDDEDFRFLCGVDSELDRFPLGPERALWAKDALAEVDPVLEDMRRHYAPGIVRVAKKLREQLNRGWLKDWADQSG